MAKAQRKSSKGYARRFRDLIAAMEDENPEAKPSAKNAAPARQSATRIPGNSLPQTMREALRARGKPTGISRSFYRSVPGVATKPADLTGLVDEQGDLVVAEPAMPIARKAGKKQVKPVEPVAEQIPAEPAGKKGRSKSKDKDNAEKPKDERKAKAKPVAAVPVPAVVVVPKAPIVPALPPAPRGVVPTRDDPLGLLAKLAGRAKASTSSELAREIGAAKGSPLDARALATELRRQVELGRLLEVRPGKYLLSGIDGEHGAIITAGSDGQLTARLPDGELVKVHPSYAIRAKPGDVVQVKLGEDHQAVVTRILRRVGREVVGTVVWRDSGQVLMPDNRREGQLAVRSVFAGFDDQYHAGDRVVGELDVSPDGSAGVRLTRILGTNTPEITDFEHVRLVHDLPGGFPPEVETEAVGLAAGAVVKGKRVDVRQKLVFTIDPVTAKDFDDAISLEPGPDGGWIIGVHIADVSHYVRPGTAVDLEAATRGTSIYLINRVIPMLPEVLSNGLCSLVPNEDRLCLTAFLTLDKDRKLVGTKLAETIIHSHHRLTYEQALAIIEDRDGDHQFPGELRDVVKETCKLAQAIRRDREKAGALNLYSVESGFRLDVEGNPVETVRETSDIAHQLIEELMLLANRAVAAWLDEHGLPCPYRVHAAPDPERLRMFAAALESCGIDGRGAYERFGLQRILLLLANEPPARRRVLNFLLLRCFSKAIYQTDNIGHFALAFSHYAHFTSPIRRYPDLMVHRLVKHGLKLKDYKNVEVRPQYLDALAKQSTWLEQRAEDSERDLHARKAARYLHSRIGERFSAVVTGVTPGGLHVLMLDTGLDGFLPMREIAGDFWEYVQERMALVGRRSGAVWGVGKELEVVVAAVEIDKADVTLSLAPASMPSAVAGGVRQPSRDQRDDRPRWQQDDRRGRKDQNHKRRGR